MEWQVPRRAPFSWKMTQTVCVRSNELSFNRPRTHAPWPPSGNANARRPSLCTRSTLQRKRSLSSRRARGQNSETSPTVRFPTFLECLGTHDRSDIFLKVRPRGSPSRAPRLTQTPRPVVEFALSKIKSDDELLKLVHRSMFRTPGKATVIKKNIRAFSGFPEGFDSAKTEDLFNRAFAATLNAVLDLFDLPRGVGEEGKRNPRWHGSWRSWRRPRRAAKRT